MKKNKILFSILCILYSFNCSAQKEYKICSIDSLEDYFALESSSSLFIDLDIVMRARSIFKTVEGKVDIKNGIYIFEYEDFSIVNNCISNENKEKIKKAFSGYIMHEKLRQLKTSIIETPEGKYRSYKMSLEIMYLGEKNISIKEGVIFVEKKIPVYLILDFKKIAAL